MTVQMYRRNILGVLCSLVLLASVVRTPYEVNIPLRKEGTYVIRSAYYSFLSLIPLHPLHHKSSKSENVKQIMTSFDL